MEHNGTHEQVPSPDNSLIDYRRGVAGPNGRSRAAELELRSVSA
jgi:hypothetical protein